MKSFSRRLLAHFDATRRDLPWRRAVNPYHTLVSELMLQQTVVATVIPYFNRFIARFPDLRSLAAANEADVLALWSGLGYYARGRNLHRTARAVVEQHGGVLPADESALRALPGIGPYTAAAIAAIAFGIRTFPLDGNGARVFARIFDEREAIDLPAVRLRLRQSAEALVPADRPGDFAQAVMDLGATVCRTTSPRCEICPVATMCAAARAGRAEALPVRVQKTPKRVVTQVCVALEDAGHVFLQAQPAGTLLGGTFTLPSAELGEDLKEASDGLETARRVASALGIAAATPQLVGSFRHVFTHRDVTALVFRVPCTRAASADGRWVSTEGRQEIALATFTRKALGLLAATVPAARRPPQRRARMLSPETM
ncbi:MAG TPA: A/G-specific adenine glycosylase [Polyangia bacterium]